MGSSSGSSSKFRDFLWRPFEIQSSKSTKQITDDFSKRILIAPVSGFAPYWMAQHYDKPYGTVEDGVFVIRLVPMSAVFTRGAGSFIIRGSIEADGKGSKISGHLPGPPFAIWLLALIALVSYGFIVIKTLSVLSDPSHPWDVLQPTAVLSAVVTAFTLGLFFFDRGSNEQGEGEIIGMLKDLAN